MPETMISPKGFREFVQEILNLSGPLLSFKSRLCPLKVIGVSKSTPNLVRPYNHYFQYGYLIMVVGKGKVVHL